MKHMVKKILLMGVILVSLYLSSCEQGAPVATQRSSKAIAPIGKQDKYCDILVNRVVDGDTLVLEGGQRVRLIGIDTPEMHESNKLYRDSQRTSQSVETIKELGKRSYQFTRGLLEGKRVKVEFDVEKKDKYGRLLGYVYLADGTFVNAEIVKQGYASIMTYPPNVKYADLFLKLSQEARENKRGLWQ
ncbi:MAG: thermonuclease family protein [Candidatus Omnitrophota bacterium]|jgi:micrococcal nuclease